ncbi:MAG: PDZ domain-containing protein [Alphaproteobacteria bacterium]|nr:PDZ domain-containing protein [Alphaproteobacteria bacterium]
MKKVKTVFAGRLGLAAGVLALVGAATLAPNALAQQQQTKQLTAAQAASKPIAVTPPAGAPMSFADLIDRVSPAVVSVEVFTEIKASKLEKQFNPFRGLPGFDDYADRFGKKGDDNGDGADDDSGSPETNEEGRSLGSGFFISPAGYIVTNNHVVENAREVVVSLKDGQELEADIVGTDKQTDLAVLKVKKQGTYPYVEFATKSRPRVGDWVIAVGNPFGLGGTATAGIVSADGRVLTGENYSDYIQVDAPINKGNSGGPTFNLQGQVIGVNTAIFSDTGGGSVGIGFAIEAKTAQKISETLIKDGKVVRGWLGVEIQSMNQQFADAWSLKSPNGAIVANVTKGGPAESSGIKRDDIITAVNDEEVKDSRELTKRVGGLLAGSKNTFTIIRQGKEQKINVTVRARDDAALQKVDLDPTRANMPKPKPGPNDVKVLNGSATTRPLSATEASHFEVVAPSSGLMVVTADAKGPLGKAFILPGDALLAINDGKSVKPLKTPKDLDDAAAAARSAGKENIVISVGCGDQERCGDQTSLRTITIKPE